MGSDHYYDHHESEDLGTPGPFRDQEFARSNQPSPLPVDSSFPMQQRFRGAYDVPGSNRGSLAPSSTFSAGLADSERANSPLMKEGYSDNPHAQRSSTDLPYPPDRYNTTTAPTRSRFRTLLLIGLGVFILIILAVIIPVYFTVIKPKADNLGAIGGSSSGGSSTASASKPSQTNVITGGDGSTITTETGETFVYHNQFGGYWIDDPNNPFNDGAQAQSYAPPLNQTWRYGIDPIRG
jgi:glucan 1,3-beta-glucosidase